MSGSHSRVEVRLVPTGSEVRPAQPLSFRLELRNHGPADLREATAELTAEVERGVLLTWELTLAAVSAGETQADAVCASSPEWSLPRNVPAGLGRWHVTVRGAGGEVLAEDRAELPVTEG